MPILGTIASSFLASSNSYFSIASTTIDNTSTSSVTFSSIPNTYKHLQVRLFVRNNRNVVDGGPLPVTFNGDTGSNYAYSGLYVTQGGNFAYYSINDTKTFVQRQYGANAGANLFGATTFTVIDYASTSKTKILLSEGGGFTGDSTDVSYMICYGGEWNSTNAITSMTIASSLSSNYAVGSIIALYGIKG